MKKIFTLFAVAAVAMGFMNAQDTTPEGVVLIAQSTYDATTSDASLYKFTNGWSMKMENRSWKLVTAKNGWAEAINFKNGASGTIQIPDGQKLYRIDMLGFSQSDAGNWEYLAAYGVGEKTVEGLDGSYEYVANTTFGQKDNDVIKSLEYPISAEAYLDSLEGAPKPFAVLNFGNEPYEGDFKMVFTGNNQVDVCFICYTTAEAAAAGYEMYYSGIQAVNNDARQSNEVYNILGQRVGNDYKGIVIRNGRKYLVK